MTMSTPLTAAEYQAKRIAFEEELATAQAALDAAEYSHSVSEIVDAELHEARQTVATVEARIRGLDATYRQTVRLSKAATAKAREQRMDTALKAVHEAEARRSTAFAAIVAGIEALEPEIRKYRAAVRSLVANGRDCARSVSDFVEEAQSTRREADFIAAALFDAGFDLFGCGRNDSSLRRRDEGLGVDQLNAQRTRRILSWLAESETL
jgi:hypothetical protein